MKQRRWIFIAVFLVVVVIPAQAATVRMECVDETTRPSNCAWIKDRFERETPHTLEFAGFPPSPDDRFTVFQQMFAAKDGKTVDVFWADITWLGILDRHLLDLTDLVADLRPNFFEHALLESPLPF